MAEFHFALKVGKGPKATIQLMSALPPNADKTAAIPQKYLWQMRETASCQMTMCWWAEVELTRRYLTDNCDRFNTGGRCFLALIVGIIDAAGFGLILIISSQNSKA